MTVVGEEQPITGLAATNDSPTPLGDTTTLTATVETGTNVQYEWDFGDGSVGTGAEVGHVYPAVGDYVASVLAYNTVSSETTTTTVTITDVPIQGLAAVNDSPTLLGGTTTFTATITAGSNVDYTWDFGDGITLTGQVVMHAYEATGTYTATVTATNSLGSVTVETVAIVYTIHTYLPIIYRQ
jgi:PKD repeat protein